MAILLNEAVAMTSKLERRLDVTGGWQEATAEVDREKDPTASVRITCALLLRKARIHTLAVVRANEASNLHSLAVQMRPVLECAGQVVFNFQTTIIAPDLFMSREKAMAEMGNRLNADFYQTMRRRTQGSFSHDKLRKMATDAHNATAASFRDANPTKQESWRFPQADKVATLANGRVFYKYLSEHFSHGRVADWKGVSWRGGVVSINRVEDVFAFIGLMANLVEHVAHMNAAAALCPVAEDENKQWELWVEPMLAHQRYVRESSKRLMDTARGAVTGDPGGSA